jgi:hypothetical protein
MSEVARKLVENQPFNIMIVGQSGRLQYESMLFVASLRKNSPHFRCHMIVVEPQAGPKWAKDPTMSADVKNALLELGAEIAQFETVHFGDILRVLKDPKKLLMFERKWILVSV